MDDAKRDKQVTIYMKKLEGEIQRAEALIADVVGLLKPIMLEDPPPESNDHIDEVLVPLAGQLRSYNCRISNISNELEKIVHQNEL